VHDAGNQDETTSLGDIKGDKSSKYRVLVQKVPSALFPSSNSPFPEQVFESLYSTMDVSFWLDSSTGRRDGDIVNTTETSRTRAATQPCPIASNSRFSIMGGNDGPLCQRLEYYGREHAPEKQGLYISMGSDVSPSNRTRCNEDVLSFLKREMARNGVIESIDILDLDSKFERKLYEFPSLNGGHCNQAIHDGRSIPFNYRGGYVGFLGYEVRHDARRTQGESDTVYGRSNVSTHASSSDHTNQIKCNPNVPTAAFIFADRSLVYDHWRGDWYAIGVALNNEGNSSTYSGIGDDNYRGSVADTITWMSDVCRKLKSIQLSDDDVGADPIANAKQNKGGGETNSIVEFTLLRSKEQYQSDIARCHEEINNGESYELCLTNQLRARVSPLQSPGSNSSVWPFGLYKILRKRNPAPFSAFLKFDAESTTKRESLQASVTICCSSPERFLSATKKTGTAFSKPFFMIESKPIKGTVARWIRQSDDELVNVQIDQDAKLAEYLRQSVKNRAENLMIVDLIRNDLSRTCIPGKVLFGRKFRFTLFEFNDV